MLIREKYIYITVFCLFLLVVPKTDLRAQEDAEMPMEVIQYENKKRIKPDKSRRQQIREQKAYIRYNYKKQSKETQKRMRKNRRKSRTWGKSTPVRDWIDKTFNNPKRHIKKMRRKLHKK